MFSCCFPKPTRRRRRRESGDFPRPSAGTQQQPQRSSLMLARGLGASKQHSAEALNRSDGSSEPSGHFVPGGSHRSSVTVATITVTHSSPNASAGTARGRSRRGTQQRRSRASSVTSTANTVVVHDGATPTSTVKAARTGGSRKNSYVGAGAGAIDAALLPPPPLRASNARHSGALRGATATAFLPPPPPPISRTVLIDQAQLAAAQRGAPPPPSPSRAPAAPYHDTSFFQREPPNAAANIAALSEQLDRRHASPSSPAAVELGPAYSTRLPEKKLKRKAATAAAPPAYSQAVLSESFVLMPSYASRPSQPPAPTTLTAATTATTTTTLDAVPPAQVASVGNETTALPSLELSFNNGAASPPTMAQGYTSGQHPNAIPLDSLVAPQQKSRETVPFI